MAVWGVVAGGVWGWSLAVFAVALVALATLLKYLIPARWMRDGGVPAIVLVAGAVGGIIGFFVIPVVGIIVGFGSPTVLMKSIVALTASSGVA